MQHKKNLKVRYTELAKTIMKSLHQIQFPDLILSKENIFFFH